MQWNSTVSPTPALLSTGLMSTWRLWPGTGVVSGHGAGVAGGSGAAGRLPPQWKGSLGHMGAARPHLLRLGSGMATLPSPSIPIFPFTIRLARSSKSTAPPLSMSWHM